MVGSLLILGFFVSLAVVPESPNQPAESPITNAHVVAMVKARIQEDLIISLIQARPTNLDTSPEAVIELKTQGVSDNVIRAVVAAAASRAAPAEPDPVAAAAAAQAPAQPFALLIRGEEKQPLAASHAQIAQVKAKLGDDFASVAMSLAAQEVALEMGARLMAATALKFGSTAAGAFGGPLVAASMLFQKAPTYTFVLALSGSQATTKLQGSELKVELRYEQVPGTNPDTHEPLLLKLSPTNGNLRMFRAQKLKLKGGGFEPGKDKILQATVPATVTSLGRGHALLEATGLAPGEYGIILRNAAPTEASLYPPRGLGQGPYDLSTIVWDFSLSPKEEEKPNEATPENSEASSEREKKP